MVFSSNLFLFGFLPAFPVCLFIVPARFRNAFILAASLANFPQLIAGPIVRYSEHADLKILRFI
jgi:hypothetical protein